MKMKIDLCFKARVQLTLEGHEILKQHSLRCDVESRHQLVGDVLTVPVWKLMAIFGEHFRRRPTDKYMPFVENEIELEEMDPSPDEPCE